jgi:hypothetical protein
VFTHHMNAKGAFTVPGVISHRILSRLLYLQSDHRPHMRDCNEKTCISTHLLGVVREWKNPSVTSVYAGGNFDLVWPPDLFRTELTALINGQGKVEDWPARVELLLEDALATGVPRDMFSRLNEVSDAWSTEPRVPRKDPGKQFLVDLLRRVDQLPQPQERRPYWSERRSGDGIPIMAVTREFARIVGSLEQRGYLEEAFEKDCVDERSTVNPAALLHDLTGRPDLWPLDTIELSVVPDAFFDLIEALYDIVSRPRNRSYHSYSDCGWHHSDFSRQSGRSVYAWQINRLLDRSNLGIRLATEGEDAGRLIELTDDARSDLVQRMAERQDKATGDRVRHAIALFRNRSATEHDKRSAGLALALVLEERRALLKKELLSKDEGALFQLANEFAVRHQDGKQHGDYDPVFRDWIFWWYLATIELTDRLIERRAD